MTRQPSPQAPSRAADILIVGAGTAGCVLAARLSSDPTCQVMLIEAGGDSYDPLLSDPGSWPSLIGGRYDWGYATSGQYALDGRRLDYPRGKVLGGSSSINALGHQRGDRTIFDNWEAQGCHGWGFEGLLPFFKRSETFEGGEDDYRGGDGPLHIIRPSAGLRSRFASSFLEGAQARGYAFNPDFNGTSMAGAAWNQLAIHKGARDSAAVAYLHPALSRPNLKVVTRARALELRLQEDRCVGVRACIRDQVEDIDAAETILCAGAIDSPRLLLLSGIGAPDALRQAGVETRIASSEVGANLQDHPLCGVVYATGQETEPSNYNHGEAIVFARSADCSGSAPDLQVMAVDVPFSSGSVGPAPAAGVSIVACLMRPDSRGSVSLAGADALSPAIIDPNYLSEPSDQRAFVAALELAVELGASVAANRSDMVEIYPGPTMRAAAERLAFARRAVSPFFHPVGTCRMGNDDSSVVDLDLRVRGARGLRVVDASVMPIIPNAMPNATIVALAEKAADIILYEHVHAAERASEQPL